ncbi:MAG: hypothetical protein WC817_03190 [Patescibacteria group bacterium]|jgi:hypothetical protein
MVSIGLIFHAFVTAVVSVVAFILVYELFSKHLSHIMSAYGLFWLATGLLWAQNAYRNTLLGVGVEDFPRFTSAVFSQATVFLSGIPLYYYVGLKVFKNVRIARILAFLSFIVSVIGSWFLAQPNGVIFEPITFFTTEAVANPVSAILFRVSIAVLALLLLYDSVTKYREWKMKKSRASGYELLYNSAILLYIFLGAIDLAKVVSDWQLVVFRILYCAAFLMVYLSIRHQRETSSDYLYVRGESFSASIKE